jgi:pyrrolidone-carboxylate peptidase
VPRSGLSEASAKVLVYGFGPYDDFEHNVTEAVIRRLRPHRRLATEVFGVRLSRTMFRRALARHRPAIVIGLGQHRTGRKLRLERKAVNLMGRRGGPLRPIDRSGPARLFVNLHLPETAETTVAYDAGRFVCNFSMYLMLQHCREAGCRFGFVHIPHGYAAAAAAAYVRNAVAFALNRRQSGPR